jgi:hypothetical protein
MLQRWRDGHGRADAVDMWKTAQGVRVGEYAFTAVACDHAALSRLPLPLAEKLARDAVGYVGTLRGIVGQRSPSDSPAAAAIHAVLRAISRWQEGGRRAGAKEEDSGLAAAETDEFSEMLRVDDWKTALKTYPQFDETTGAMTLAAVVALGPRGLSKVREPWDGVLALGAARYLARARRGDLMRPAPALEDTQAALAGIQEYASATGRSPWNVGYTGRVGSPATQALRLSRDAGLCSDIAAALPGGPAARGFAIWTEAEEHHAFASMALDRSLVMGMPVEEARRFASAAIRRGAALLAAPPGTKPLDAAGLPPDSLAAVMLAARAIMPNGPQPRSWESKSVDALDKVGVRYSIW